MSLIDREKLLDATNAAMPYRGSHSMNRREVLALIAAAPAVPSLTTERLATIEDALDWIESAPEDASHVLANVARIRTALATPEGTEPK